MVAFRVHFFTRRTHNATQSSFFPFHITQRILAFRVLQVVFLSLAQIVLQILLIIDSGELRAALLSTRTRNNKAKRKHFSPHTVYRRITMGRTTSSESSKRVRFGNWNHHSPAQRRQSRRRRPDVGTSTVSPSFET